VSSRAARPTKLRPTGQRSVCALPTYRIQSHRSAWHAACRPDQALFVSRGELIMSPVIAIPLEPGQTKRLGCSNPLVPAGATKEEGQTIRYLDGPDFGHHLGDSSVASWAVSVTSAGARANAVGPTRRLAHTPTTNRDRALSTASSRATCGRCDQCDGSTRSIATLRRVRADAIIASVTSTTRSPSRPVAAGWPPVATARWKSSISAT
jgi:hypothetical protein